MDDLEWTHIHHKMFQRIKKIKDIDVVCDGEDRILVAHNIRIIREDHGWRFETMEDKMMFLLKYL
jgi:hypothetical protein